MNFEKDNHMKQRIRIKKGKLKFKKFLNSLDNRKLQNLLLNRTKYIGLKDYRTKRSYGMSISGPFRGSP